MDYIKKEKYNLILLIVLTFTLAVVLSSRIPSLEKNKLTTNYDINILSFNTEYWHNSEKELAEEINYKKYDIIFLQEHLKLIGNDHYPTNRIPELKKAVKDRYIDVNGEVVTISKMPIIYRKAFGQGTGLRTDILTNNGKIISAYNVHLPVHLHLDLIKTPHLFWQDVSNIAKDRESFIHSIVEDIRSNNHPKIIAGDFNTSLFMNSINFFRENMTDAYSFNHCKRQYGTWSLLPMLSWRIDYIFLSEDFKGGNYCSNNFPNISDHKSITAKLKLKSGKNIR